MHVLSSELACKLLNLIKLCDFSGIVTGPLIKRFGFRKVTITGALIGVVGFCISFMATGLQYLYISFGLVVG